MKQTEELEKQLQDLADKFGDYVSELKDDLVKQELESLTNPEEDE